MMSKNIHYRRAYKCNHYIRAIKVSVYCKKRSICNSAKLFFSSTNEPDEQLHANPTSGGDTNTATVGKDEDPYLGYNLTVRQRRAIKLLDTRNDSDVSKPINSESDIVAQADLSQILKAMKEEAQIQELERYKANPIPWYNLLNFPSRALWRSSPIPPPDYIKNAQFDIIQKSERTPKQLRRTIENIVKSQKALGIRRERERRTIVNGKKSTAGAPTSLENKKVNLMDKRIKPVYYKPEQTLCSLKYRLVPNYNIMKRILRETEGLLGKKTFQPRKVLDVGIGIGSSSAAVLDIAFERFMKENTYCQKKNDNDDDDDVMNKIRRPDDYDGVEWIHGVDPSVSMKDGAQRLLQSVIEGQQNEIRMDSKNTRRLKNTRITYDEALSVAAGRDISKSRGTYDLAICSYTLCEIPNVAANLTLAAMIWEKLSPNGIAIFVEPGTPDGFNSLRSVRNLLLDCCPPTSTGDYIDEDMIGDEECHVIAPCTHNGTCPMVRHKKLFNKKEDENENENLSNEDIDHGWEEEDVDDDDELFEEEEDLKLNIDEEDTLEEVDLEHEVLNSMEESVAKHSPASKSEEVDYYDSGFCSFVHGMPGGNGKRGEKFTYLVLQKRVTGQENIINDEQDPFHDIDIVDMLNHSMNESMKDSKKKKRKLKKERVSVKNDVELKKLLDEASEIERDFINSEEDLLGLELVKGKHNSWGRIIRTPIKKKGHVLVDYCTSSQSMETEIDDEEPVETGKIIRHKVTRSHSQRGAPGMYLAARKSRWGGLWPDVKSS